MLSSFVEIVPPFPQSCTFAHVPTLPYFHRPIIFRQTAVSVVTFLLRWLEGCFLCPVTRHKAGCTFQRLCLAHVPCPLQAFETQDGLLWVSGLANVYIYQMTVTLFRRKGGPVSLLLLSCVSSHSGPCPPGGDRGSIVVPRQRSCLFANFFSSP